MPTTEPGARTALKALLKDFNRLTPDDRRQMSETSIVHQFIDRLFEEVLGWPVKDPARYKYELYTESGRPDMILTPEAGGVVYVEAKRFGVIKELEHTRKLGGWSIGPDQLPLPGMSNDRTREEQQAINYAFSNGGTWAILTNFEKLRIFNAKRDWLIMSFERPAAYLDDFDMLWELSYPRLLNGSLDALSRRRYSADVVDTEYLKFINKWREDLAKDVIRRREQNPWAFRPDGSIDLPLLRAVVQRFIDRLVIVRYAEDQLVIPSGILYNLYEAASSAHQPAYGIYYVYLEDTIAKFFRRFDEAHNSALFAENIADQASFGQEVLLRLFEDLYRARYRSMPADIMGNTYEQYLGKTLIAYNDTVKTADNLETRKKQGSYYTPQTVVHYIVDNSLGRYLYGTANGKPDGQPVPNELRKTSTEIRDLRVLDGACGSGSFLIYAYEVLAGFYESESERLRAEAETKRAELAARGITDPLGLSIQLTPYTAELARLANFPRLILETHLYGVDLDPQAAEIAVVNLLMRGIAGNRKDKRFPMLLNQNIKVGNSLIGLRADDPRMRDYGLDILEIRRLRRDLIATPDGPEHKRIIRDLDQLNAALRDKLNMQIGEQFSEFALIRPFHWGAEFPEAFYDDDGELLPNAGFAIIFGNPPWEILKPDLREYYAQFDPAIESKLSREKAEARIESLVAEDGRRRVTFESATRAIEETTAYVRLSGDYQRQGRGDPATHKMFLERMFSLLHREGRLGYVVPSGLYTDLGTKPLREMLLDEGSIQYLFSFSNERFFFSGVHHKFKFALIGVQKGTQTDGFWAAFRFDPRVAVRPEELPDFLSNPANLVYVKRESLPRFSPDSLSILEFQTAQDYAIAEKLHNAWPMLGAATLPTDWTVKFANEMHMTSDRDLFTDDEWGCPLYEGKMIYQFTPYHAGPKFWVDAAAGRKRMLGKAADEDQILSYQQYRVAVRAISSSTNERTLIATMLPRNCFAGNSLLVIRDLPDPRYHLYLTALFNSFTIDWIMKLRIASNINMFYLYQLPIPRLTPGDPVFDALVERALRLTCIRPEFADLWASVSGKSWDESLMALSDTDRVCLRDETDAIVAHLYGLTRGEFERMLDSFPLVFPLDDELAAAHRVALRRAFRQFTPR
jgi:hypothetical protein